jgi:hypothetical protein
MPLGDLRSWLRRWPKTGILAKDSKPNERPDQGEDKAGLHARNPNYADGAELARMLRQSIDADRFPRVQRWKELLASLTRRLPLSPIHRRTLGSTARSGSEAEALKLSLCSAIIDAAVAAISAQMPADAWSPVRATCSCNSPNNCMVLGSTSSARIPACRSYSRSVFYSSRQNGRGESGSEQFRKMKPPKYLLSGVPDRVPGRFSIGHIGAADRVSRRACRQMDVSQ